MEGIVYSVCIGHYKLQRDLQITLVDLDQPRPTCWDSMALVHVLRQK